MELRYTKEQEELLRAVRHFAETEIAPQVHAMEREDEFPSRLLKRMAQLGLMGLPIPTKWGGAGSDFIAYTIAVNEISKVSATLGVILSVHTSVGTFPIIHYGTEEQRMKYVRRLASGESLGAFALTETHAGSDAASIRTTASLSGDHYILNGTKMFITNAGAADIYIAFAVTDYSKGAGGITAFIIESGTEGLRVGRKEKKMGLHGSNTCELHFDQIKIPVSQRLGAEGDGFAIAKGSLDGGRIGIGAQALGIAEAALQLIHCRWNPYRAKGSHTPGKLKPEHAELADLTAKVEAARLLVYRAAYLRQEGLSCTKEASMAKMFASDTAVEVTGAAVRLYGLQGCLKELPAERLFRDAKVTQIYEGTNEIHRIVISNQLLK
ncbi:acyl-CoA dehydrogenase family protein [Paenibacillus alkaliterrae]|uniref:acyl-CoA dehydrogenase family protein n=1 Tax=Paenibacillus alkaliterrae TaxID=320909 RepID=UPI001F342E92|nr:acyl-CoA dehydrogenase family protein [Paenibacillus alkaliterrae]MCF2940152.1 acyl-CoA dehydrogenase family protein [Paenibacillus alkaliterrae]